MRSCHLRHDSAHNSTKFIISSKFTLQILLLNIFHKKAIEYYSCKLLPNCVQFRNALENFRSSNYPKSNDICLNFLFCSFSQYLKSVSAVLQKSFRFGFITKKRFSPQFFAECFIKNIHNLKVKMLYQNREHTFVLVLYYLIFTGEKFSCQYHEIYSTWSSSKLRMFLQKPWNCFFRSGNLPLISTYDAISNKYNIIDSK